MHSSHQPLTMDESSSILSVIEIDCREDFCEVCEHISDVSNLDLDFLEEHFSSILLT